MPHGYNLRPRRKRAERLLPLFWYRLPDDILWYIGQVQRSPRYPLRSSARKARRADVLKQQCTRVSF